MRRGLTLIELLVVIVILLILTAVAIPALSPNTEQRRIREGARLLSTYISTTRNQAVSLGRQVGFQIECLPANPNAAIMVRTIEVPPPYSGDVINATCQVYYDPNQAKLQVNVGSTAFNPALVKVGDTIKFNYQGHTYRITGPETSPTDPTIAAGTTILDIVAPVNAPYPWATSIDSGATVAVNNAGTWVQANPIISITPAAYQITRGPSVSSSPPLQLPEGSAIDLSVSVSGGSPLATGVTKSLGLMFKPDGSIGDKYVDGVRGYLPTGNIFLHVGRVEGTMPADLTAPNQLEATTFNRTDRLWNLRDLNNLWIGLGKATGNVVTAENGKIDDGDVNFTDATFSSAKNDATSIVRSMQSMGGR